MSDYFTFGIISTDAYGISVYDLNTDSSPEDMDEGILIPGRNGRLLLENRFFDNVIHRYMCVIHENKTAQNGSVVEQLALYRDAILGQQGYQKLTDSIHTDEFYIARYIGGLEAELTPDRKMAKFVIEFSRKPQRFLKTGDEPQTLTNGQILRNPTAMIANPLIKVIGSNGYVYVDSQRINIATNSMSYITIDSEMKDCYYSTSNCNQYVTFSNNEFPKLMNHNPISWGGGVSGVTITPRWWRA